LENVVYAKHQYIKRDHTTARAVRTKKVI